MPDFEFKAVIEIIGYENITAASLEEATKKLEKQIENSFVFSVKLSNKSSELTIIAVKDEE